MNAKSLQKRVDTILNRINGMDRIVYIRSFTQSPNTDALIGRETGTTSDTKVSPQPAYRNLTTRDVVYLSSLGKKVSAEDYAITFSSSSITEAVLDEPSTLIVLKSPDGTQEESLRIIDFNSKGFQGQTLVWSVVARSVTA